MLHTPRRLTVLGLTRVLSHHPATLLKQALHSEKWAGCPDFGSHLFLPTCERACYECLDPNEVFRVSNTSLARDCFHLTEEQLSRILIIYNALDRYILAGPGHATKRITSSRWRQVKHQGLEIYGLAGRVMGLTREWLEGTMELVSRSLGSGSYTMTSPSTQPPCSRRTRSQAS